MAFDASGTKLFASSGGDPVVRVWDTRSGSLLRTLPLGWAYDVAMDHNTGRMAVGVAGKVLLVSVASGTVLREFKTAGGQWVEEVAFSRDGKLVAGVDGFKRVTIWDAGTGVLLQKVRWLLRELTELASARR